MGRALRARGLTVELSVGTDELFFVAQAEIVVTSPDEDGAEIRLTDEGYLTWTRDYWPEAAVVGWEPAFHWSIPDPAKLAGDIAAKVTQAAAA